MAELARELHEFLDSDEGRAETAGRELAVVLPAGTGATALLLQLHAQNRCGLALHALGDGHPAPPRFHVFAAPVMRSGLAEDMRELLEECVSRGPPALRKLCAEAEARGGALPAILPARPPHFAQPSRRVWEDAVRLRTAATTRAHVFGEGALSRAR